MKYHTLNNMGKGNMLDSSGGLQDARANFREHMVRWGFAWAIWCAVLWGLWYVPGSAIYAEAPFVSLIGTTSGYLQAAVIITTFNAIAVLLAMYIWNAVLGKTKDYARTFRQVSLSKWFFLGAICGGPMAIFGSFLAIGYIGGGFAAVAALLYPIIGAFTAWIWYNEALTRRAVLGIAVIMVGGVVVYLPGLIENLTSGGPLLGYVGGAMAAIGWGLEGAVAGRALDVSDPDVGLTIRFTAETAYWIVLILPLTIILGGASLLGVIGQMLINPWNLLWLTLAGLTFGFCYVSWYKSFPLIGVGRGQAIAAFYGLFALIFLGIFTLEFGAAELWIGAAIIIAGGFIMFTEKREVLEVVRSRGDITKVKGESQQVVEKE